MKTFAITDDDGAVHRDTYVRPISKYRRMQQQQQHRETISTHKNYYPDSFVYRRGDHPYGTREYLLVHPKPTDDTETSHDGAQQGGDNWYRQEQQPDGNSSSTTESLRNKAIILATLHANNNIVFGASVNATVIREGKDETDDVPSILDLCPILLHAALTDCSNEGEQPQALSTLHGLSAWVRQCLDDDSPIQSTVIQALQERMKDPTAGVDHVISSSSAVGRQIMNVDARQQLECLTAIATNIPRPGHSVVGQRTHADGAFAWEALSREYALLDYDNDNTATIKLSEECLLYRKYAESCELVEIQLLADTSPAYLLSAGGAMARFFVM